MADLIAMQEIEGRGRAIISTRPIKAGEILLTDSPILLYPANPLNNRYCFNCFKTLDSSSLHPCPNCSNQTLFCSPNCQSKALSSSHSNWVCQALISLRHYSSISPPMSVDDISDAYFLVITYNLAVIDPSSFRVLLSLEGDNNVGHDSRTLALHSLISSFSPPQSGFSLDLTAALLAKDKRNAFALMEPFVENGEGTVRAYGIYPNASFFNHDCLPNAVRFDYVDTSVGVERNVDIVIRAIHDFPQGREICLSYFGVKWSYAERQKRLMEDYGFVCNCDRCKVEVNWKEDDDGSMEENGDEQMMALEEEYGEQEENDFPHAYFFVKYVCSRENCGGTLAPLPPSDGTPSEVMECNVCGQLRTGEDIDGDESEDGVMVDE
ncbi:hypothetical protein ACHQM5_025914 [Ranunculus cassubicifolius]